jgi:hypothetical protein
MIATTTPQRHTTVASQLQFEIPETAEVIWRMMRHRRNRLETFR